MPWLAADKLRVNNTVLNVLNEYVALCCMAQIPLGSTRLDSTRHIRRVEPMHFGCVELVEEHSSTRSTRRTRLARLARHDELDWLDWLDTSSSTGATCNLVMITVIHLLISYSLIN